MDENVLEFYLHTPHMLSSPGTLAQITFNLFITVGRKNTLDNLGYHSMRY
jgi:hypothetical protein